MDPLKLKQSNCKHCYKCIRNCPVKSIRFTGQQAHIIQDDCILCGRCYVICPQEAKEIAEGRELVQTLLHGSAPVYASIAPSFIANYDGIGIEAMEEALMALGFAGAEETAIGATIVKREYDRILLEEKPDILISSCCHTVNLLIEHYYPDLLHYLANTLSPMQAHCADIKKRHPDAKTVFIGPCISKIDEADRYKSFADAVMTFGELSSWLEEEGISPAEITEENNNSKARFFPTSGGILKSMDRAAKDYTYLAVDGMRNCMAALDDLRKGSIHKCFIEMSSCNGSCVEGPVMEKLHRSPVKSFVAISDYAGENDFPVSTADTISLKKEFTPRPSSTVRPSSREIERILAEMGKTDPAAELNCGSCGYDSCRKKAEAVLAGKAEISMCLPYLMEKTESFSNIIVRNMPGGIIVLNDMLEVQQINRAALDIFNLKDERDLLGTQIVRVMDPLPMLSALDSGSMLKDERVYLPEYSRTVEETIVPVPGEKLLICMLKDVTEKEEVLRHRDEISKETIDVADRVIEHQMRVVQEIASLLGETAAETKIALTKLKESIHHE